MAYRPLPQYEPLDSRTEEVFWKTVSRLVRHFAPDDEEFVSRLKKDVDSRSPAQKQFFYHQSPVEVLQTVLDRPLRDDETPEALEIQVSEETRDERFRKAFKGKAETAQRKPGAIQKGSGSGREGFGNG